MTINPDQLIADLMSKLHRGLLDPQSATLEADLRATVEGAKASRVVVAEDGGVTLATPRTDEAEKETASDLYRDYVKVEFARQLERELVASTASLNATLGDFKAFRELALNDFMPLKK